MCMAADFCFYFFSQSTVCMRFNLCNTGVSSKTGAKFCSIFLYRKILIPHIYIDKILQISRE